MLIIICSKPHMLEITTQYYLRKHSFNRKNVFDLTLFKNIYFKYKTYNSKSLEAGMPFVWSAIEGLIGCALCDQFWCAWSCGIRWSIQLQDYLIILLFYVVNQEDISKNRVLLKPPDCIEQHCASTVGSIGLNFYLPLDFRTYNSNYVKT